MCGWIRLIEIIGIVLLLAVSVVVGSRVSAGSGPAAGESGGPPVDGFGASSLTGLVNRLRESGNPVTVAGGVHQPLLSIDGRIVYLDGESLQVFEYSDVASAAADTARIWSNGSGSDSVIVDWVDSPHLYRNGRLLVIYVGESSRIQSLVSALLGPQFAGRR